LKRTFMGISIIAVLGMGLLLAGCGDQAASGSGSTGSQDAAKSAFLAERGSGTPGATSSGTAVAGGQGGRPPGVFGAVQKVDGNKITVKSQADGTETVVQLASGATIRKQADAQASDIKEGETVSAIGTKSGDTLDARTVQIGNGGFGAFGGGGFAGGNGTGRGFRGNNGTPGPQGNGGFGNGASPSGTPRAGFGNGQGSGRFRGNNGTPIAGGTPGVAPDFVAGTVAKVDGNTVTVTMNDSTSGTFTISATTRLQKEVDIQATDLKEGDNVVATGQLNGDVFEATALQVIDRVPGAGQTPTP
jgi:preprotein translocase subunit YajC